MSLTSLSSINFPTLKYPQLGLLSFCHNSTVIRTGISLRAYPTSWMSHPPNNKQIGCPSKAIPAFLVSSSPNCYRIKLNRVSA